MVQITMARTQVSRMNRAVNTCVRLFAEAFEPSGPVLEIGSLYLPGFERVSDLRPYFAGREYVGCDIRRGLGVDRVEDVERLSFADETFGTAMLCEVVAHLPYPSRAISEVRRVLREDGIVAVSTPFDFRLNAFPSDYWRFTSAGLSILLDDFPAQAIFSLGPRVKPAVVFAVVGKQESEAFTASAQRFEELVKRTFHRSRLHGHVQALERSSRELIGCLLGRAQLGVQFYERDQRGGYRDEARSSTTAHNLFTTRERSR